MHGLRDNCQQLAMDEECHSGAHAISVHAHMAEIAQCTGLLNAAFFVGVMFTSGFLLHVKGTNLLQSRNVFCRTG